MELFATRVLRADPEAADQVRLVLADPRRLVELHLRAGQYCHLRAPGGEESFYALLSTPAERTLSFLVKRAGDAGGELAVLRAGDRVEVSEPTGPGFDVEAASERDVVMVATGTGIAPIRAVLEEILARREAFGSLTLYYGVRDPSFVALRGELDRWRGAGVAVRLHYSRPAGTDEDEHGGYVQEMILADRPDMSNAALFAAGQEELLHALADSIIHLGGQPDWILRNI